ncbi:MAG: hypothetical protein EOM54_05560 [Clostridia bacterium]|nr:hypothetical protein [Clostridia bacterium]
MEKRKWTNKEIEEFRKEHGIGFYFNKEDSNLFVPKSYGFGRTLNWANPVSWIFALAIAGFIVWSVFLR